MRDNRLSLGIGMKNDKEERDRIIRYLNLKMSSLGLPTYNKEGFEDMEIAHDLIESFKAKNRLLSNYLCPVDQRIQDFLDSYLENSDLPVKPRLPGQTLILDRYGLARQLSIAPDKNEYITDIVNTYRIKQGVLNNPRSDRRTTKGVFHVAEGGLPIPLDKKAVPKSVYGMLLHAAVNPPADLLKLPFTSSQKEQAETFVSLMLKPVVCPEVKGFVEEKRLEIRFFAPGNLVSNLDFVESIFGNAGDPFLAEHDAGLDPEHWTGHTGCIILAPHLINLTKKELGLPHVDYATERQKKDGMCWVEENEKYNDGSAFKVCARDDRGVMVTIIADNYYGYSKKEVKTQIGFSANLYGLCEEEHAGGALAFPAFNLGEHFEKDLLSEEGGHKLADVENCLGESIEMKPEGYGVDKKYPKIIYVPEDTQFHLAPKDDTQSYSWMHDGTRQTHQILHGETYVYPSGFRVCLAKHYVADTWRLIGINPKGSLIHKPCTVSGGGKSEISKSIRDAIIFGSVYVHDLEKDIEKVTEIVNYDFSKRFKEAKESGYKSRSFLDELRSLGSAIKLMNPSADNTDEYNNWLQSIPNRILSFAMALKRHYRSSWGDDWTKYFSVDVINGEPGNELKYKNNKLVGSYLRVGLNPDGTWWTCKLRQDYLPSEKLQWEDDISASVIVPSSELQYLNEETKNPSLKIVQNCEFRYFQRPDEAKNRGYDRDAEYDLSTTGNFISNFEPLKKENALEIVNKTITYHKYTDPMKNMIGEVALSNDGAGFVASSHPRIVDGKPSKNPRYLQTKASLFDGEKEYLGMVGMRLQRKIPQKAPLHIPVNSVLSGRRNNPAEKENGIRALAVYSPIHYQELPELFMDYICSLTGKSPSTTGAGSEGALTKGPFNALVATSDLNNALLSFILTGYSGFSTAAGHIGPNYRMDHDVSILIPDLWCRLSEEECDAENMIAQGYLEKISDFEHKGKKVLASRLGYRITQDFVNDHLGKVFETPQTVFSADVLQPERQDMDSFVDGVFNITEAQERVAKSYIDDGSVDAAIPPLKALLHIMLTGSYEGKGIEDPEVRDLFSREYVLSSDWYKSRLERKQANDISFYENSIVRLKNFMQDNHHMEESGRLGLSTRLENIRQKLEEVQKKEYIQLLEGTLGVDALCRKTI
ncbi:MAG: hypothetical protein HQL32_10785 [Planctomycetes bacterium]|nr:hypothetical protein [Planctomycetota bacterium]